MEINITDDAFKKHISEAILLMIGPENRDKLIAEALEQLCKKMIIESRYGANEERPSKMQDYFTDAVRGIASEEMNRLVKDDPQIKEAVSDFIKKALLHVLENDKFNASLMGTFQEALDKKLWE